MFTGGMITGFRSWLGIERKGIFKIKRLSDKLSQCKYFDWNLDIKKSTAMPPIEIRRELSEYTCSYEVC
jgi:hypothetical protein